MDAPEPDGWNASAAAWIAEVAQDGDYGRRFVLDAPMLARIRGRIRHVQLKRVSPFAVPVMMEIGRERVGGAGEQVGLFGLVEASYGIGHQFHARAGLQQPEYGLAHAKLGHDPVGDIALRVQDVQQWMKV